MLRFFALLALFGAAEAAAFAYYAISVIGRDLPEDLAAMREPPSKASRVYAADGEPIGEFFLEKRIVVDLERIPEHVRQAFVAAEDGRFWSHPGFDPLGIARAALSNYRGAGSKQGASTITQQLTRMLMLSSERTYYRKLKELLLSVRVERELRKRDILEMYLNRVYLGHGAHGVQAAAQAYFGKDVAELDVAEGALLAGLVQRPSAYSPLRDLEASRTRRAYVLSRMKTDGYISAAEAEKAAGAPVALVGGDLPLNHVAAPYFVEHIRRWAEDRYGRATYEGGLQIYSTLDTRMQRSAEAAVRDGLGVLEREIGFRGPLGHLDAAGLAAFRENPPRPYVAGVESAALGSGADLVPGVPYFGAIVELPRRGGVRLAIGARVVELEAGDARGVRRWREPPEPGERSPQRISKGDLLPVRIAKSGEDIALLAEDPEVEGALVAMDPATGAVRALVGGYDFQRSEFNRATQARRQIGSAFKPFIYGAALARGATHLDRVSDTPIVVRTAGGLWSPNNYDGKYLGTVTLRTALAKSLNTVSVRLVLKMGVDPVIELARRLGVRSPIPRHVSIALGTPDLTLLEVVGAYASFANGGLRIPSQDDGPASPPGRFVELVTTDEGALLDDFRDRLPSEEAISPSLAYLIADLMKGVVERGTGRHAQELGRPTAAKTGTSTEWRDAWFFGYTRDLMVGVWVGRDDFLPIGTRATGGTTALPIWLQFMRAAHPDTPVRDFEIPADIVLVRADEFSGEPANPAGVRRSRLVPFAGGSVPPRFTPSAKQSRFGGADSFGR